MAKQSGVMCFFKKEGKMLLVRRKTNDQKYPDRWTMPAGHIEEGESKEHAVIREMEEELGIIPIRYEFISSVLHSDAEGDRYWRLFQIHEWKGEISNKSENAEFRWFNFEEAERLDMPRSEEYLPKVRKLMEK